MKCLLICEMIPHMIVKNICMMKHMLLCLHMLDLYVSRCIFIRNMHYAFAYIEAHAYHNYVVASNRSHWVR